MSTTKYSFLVQLKKKIKNKICYLCLIASQLSDKKLNNAIYPFDPLDNILNSKKISFSVKFPFSSKIVIFNNRSILAVCIGHPTKHLSK